jgi:hypothetical protein
MILFSIAIVAAMFQAPAQTLEIDPARDRAFHDLVRAFLDDKVTAEQLDTDLREYARQFEARPYKLRTGAIEWETVPQARLFRFAEITARITSSAEQAFFRGELTAAEAALKMAAFFLIWRGYGIEPRDASLARERAQELMRKIGEFAASDDDFVFGQVAHPSVQVIIPASVR